jgi:hypothetical protein
MPGLRFSKPASCTISQASATLLATSSFGDLRPSQAEGDVVEDVEVGEDGVGLEDRVDGPAVRRDALDLLAGDGDLALRGLLEARDHAQRRRLSAP